MREKRKTSIKVKAYRHPGKRGTSASRISWRFWIFDQNDGFGVNSNLLLILILLGALIVRLWGIDFGLPYEHFGDEGHLAYWAFYSGSHALRPPYYLYSPLVSMILLVEFAFYYTGGYFFGIFSSSSQFFINYLIDPTIFFLIGRVTMAIVGVATVWLLFILGKTFFSQRIGLLASFFLAFTFLHVKESHYIKQDVLLTFFVLASFYFSLKILQRGKLKDYFLCGITFALAFGAKYHAIILLPVILLTHFLNARAIALRKLIWFGIAFLVTFSIVHPYVILETKSTIEQTFPFAVGIRVGYPEQLQGKPVWWWFLFEHVPQGIGYPLYFAAIAGFIICIFKGLTAVSRIVREQKFFSPTSSRLTSGFAGQCARNSSSTSFRVKHSSSKNFIHPLNYLLIPLLPFIFFITIGSFTQMHFARYAVMLLPFYMLAAAIFLDSLSRKLKIRNALLVIFAVVLTLPTLFRAVQFDILLTKPDIRAFAKEWFEQTVPSGSKVLVESTLRPENPSSFNISLVLDGKGIAKRIKDAEKIGQEALYLRALEQANQGKVGYDIVATTQVGARMDIFTGELTRIKDVGYYIDSGIEYIVLTSWVQEKMNQEFEKSLNNHYQLIKEFKPTYRFFTDPHLVRVDYAALDKVDIFRKDVVFGPVIRIYKNKTD